MIDLSHKKIIVTFLMHLGDLVLTTPFIHALRKAAPTADITYLVDEKLKDVVLHNPYIDHVWTIDKKGRDNHLRALWAMGQKITDGKLTFSSTFTLMSAVPLSMPWLGCLSKWAPVIFFSAVFLTPASSWTAPFTPPICILMSLPAWV